MLKELISCQIKSKKVEKEIRERMGYIWYCCIYFSTYKEESVHLSVFRSRKEGLGKEWLKIDFVFGSGSDIEIKADKEITSEEAEKATRVVKEVLQVSE